MVGNGSQLSEAQLAARHAMSHALNMPIGAGGNSLKSCMTKTYLFPHYCGEKEKVGDRGRVVNFAV